MPRFRGMDEDTVGQTLDFAYLRLLWPFVRPYKTAFIACAIMLFLSFLVELTGPYLIRLIIDGPAQEALDEGAKDYSTVWWLGLGLLASTLAGIVLGYHYTMLSADPGNDQTGRLRLEPLGPNRTRLHFEERYHLTRIPWKWFEGPIYRFINRQNELSMRRLSAWLSDHPEYRPDLVAPETATR